MRTYLLVVVGFLLVGLIAPLNASSLHPRLLKATPAPQSELRTPPREIALSFNESLDLALARVTLQRATTAVPLQRLRLAAGDDKTVIAGIPDTLVAGRYTVRWQITGDDGHPVRGEYTFDVLSPGAPRGQP